LKSNNVLKVDTIALAVAGVLSIAVLDIDTIALAVAGVLSIAALDIVTIALAVAGVPSIADLDIDTIALAVAGVLSVGLGAGAGAWSSITFVLSDQTCAALLNKSISLYVWD